MDSSGRLIEVFSQAQANASPAERERYLAQACQGQPELRQQVEALLGASERAADFLPKTIQVQPPDLVTEGPGTVIGHYKLLQQIGEGGCGVVYMAEQREPIRRRVAFKLIKLGMDTKQVIARFEAERQALALMEHPNIAKVLDAGATETGRPYFVMELVRGIRITDYCDQNNLSTEQRLDLFIRVCHAIQHAHQKGIIHRDIKPSNILVTINDGVPQPKVIDFGIAKATEQRLTDKTLFTAFEQFIGTPAYMSPEQAEMTGLDIDTRSDIYALGVLLYELLAGQTPFNAKELIAAGVEGMRRIIREQEPMRPSTCISTLNGADQTTVAKRRQTEPPELLHQVRGDLDWIVMKCLEKDRTRRYETANGLANDIERHLNCEPVMARPPSRLYQFQKLVRRHRLAVGAACVVALVLALGTAVSTWQAVRATLAERQENRLRGAAEEGQRRAETAERLARQKAYASDMKATQVALQQDNLGLARELLGRYLPQKGEEDLRGLEWRYLWQESRGDELQSFLHPAGVLCAELSPDGHFLLTVSGDRRTNLSKIFNVSTSKEIAHFATTIPVFSARPFAFSPQGNWLASQGREGLEIRNTRDWKVFRILEAGAPCCFSPDGKYLVASSTNAAWAATDNLSVWDVADWSCRVLTNTTGYPHLVFRPGETQTVCAAGVSENGAQVDVWNLETGTKTALLPSPTGYPTALGISPDGKWLAVGQFDGFVFLWDLTTRQLALRFQAHPYEAFGLAFSADGQILASGGMDQVIRLWQTGTTNQIGTPLKGHLHVVNSLAFSKDGQKLISTSQDGTAKIWDPTPKSRNGRLIKLPETAVVQRVLPDHQAVLTLDSTEEVSQVWNLADGRLLHSLSWSNWSSFNAGRKEGLHYIAEEQLLVAMATNGTVDFRDLATGAHLRSLSLGESSFNPFCLSPDDRWAFCAEGDLWDLNAAKRVHQFVGFQWPSARAFSSDSRFLAFVNTNGLVSIWDLRTMQEKRSLQANTGGLALQFSPDGRLLAFGDMEGLVWLWSAETGKLLHPPLKGHQERVGPVAFSPDGKTLLSASPFDPSVRWWHVATGQEMLISRDLRLPASHLSYRTDFNPGGKFLLFQQRRGPIQITELPTFAEIDAIEAH